VKTLIRNPRTRRTLSLSLLGLGAVLIFLAPEGALLGWIPLLLGVGVEIIGIKLGHPDGQ
jgi:hypothetical protein